MFQNNFGLKELNAFNELNGLHRNSVNYEAQNFNH